MSTDCTSLPADLPVPDRRRRRRPPARLRGAEPSPCPRRSAASSTSPRRRSERLVVYVYPRTGVPGEPLLDGWDDIPGARGCTPQSCAFRDTAVRARAPRRGPHRHQRADACRAGRVRPARAHPLSPAQRPRARARRRDGPADLRDERPELYKRLTFVAEQGRIVKVFYPVFPPDRNAGDVLAWLDRKSLTLTTK